jgi:hypothetical protein
MPKSPKQFPPFFTTIRASKNPLLRGFPDPTPEFLTENCNGPYNAS